MPLTTNGICIQILASILTYRKHKEQCTKNDCQVVINHLIRKFGEPLTKQGGQKIFKSSQIDNYTGKIIKDHLIPVNDIMRHFLEQPFELITDENVEYVSSYLKKHLIIVKITKEEDIQLTKNKLKSDMPSSYYDKNSPLYMDEWARYKEAGIYCNIVNPVPA